MRHPFLIAVLSHLYLAYFYHLLQRLLHGDELVDYRREILIVQPSSDSPNFLEYFRVKVLLLIKILSFALKFDKGIPKKERILLLFARLMMKHKFLCLLVLQMKFDNMLLDIFKDLGTEELVNE